MSHEFLEFLLVQVVYSSVAGQRQGLVHLEVAVTHMLEGETLVVFGNMQCMVFSLGEIQTGLAGDSGAIPVFELILQLSHLPSILTLLDQLILCEFGVVLHVKLPVFQFIHMLL